MIIKVMAKVLKLKENSLSEKNEVSRIDHEVLIDDDASFTSNVVIRTRQRFNLF